MNTVPRYRRAAMVLLALSAVTVFAPAADAQVVRLEVTARESVDNGRVFAGAGGRAPPLGASFRRTPTPSASRPAP